MASKPGKTNIFKLQNFNWIKYLASRYNSTHILWIKLHWIKLHMIKLPCQGRKPPGATRGKWMLAAAGTWLMQVATGRSRRSGKRSDEGLALFLGRGRGSRPRRLAAAGDGAGRRRQVPRARPAAGSLLQMTSLHGGVESEIYKKTWLCGQVLNIRCIWINTEADNACLRGWDPHTYS